MLRNATEPGLSIRTQTRLASQAQSLWTMHLRHIGKQKFDHSTSSQSCDGGGFLGAMVIYSNFA
jgi:hypothetical protein